MNRRHFIGLLGAGAAGSALAGKKTGTAPKYVFLMIGDGMGVAQRDVAERFAKLMVPGRKDGLRMNRLPVEGLTATENIKGEITDSAAAGTALACGQKTANGLLGLAEDKTTPLKSIAFDALAAGKKVGIVSDVPIDHATPAAFYAQVRGRSMFYEIDEQLPKSGFHYFAGEPMLGRNKAKGKTPPNELAENAGYTCVETRAAFDALKPGGGKVLVEHPVRYNIEGRPEIPLSDFTRKGIELLDGENGFFMMIEGGKIDWCGHANDLLSNIHETLAFDDAVGVVLDFCKKHPDDSLLVITADHECGGLMIDKKAFNPQFRDCAQKQKFQFGYYAKEITRWKKAGGISAEDVFGRITENLGLNGLPADSRGRISSSIESFLGPDGTDSEGLYGRNNPVVVSCLHEVAATANTRWISFNHTSAPVKTTAIGVGAEQFGGQFDNTDIAKRLRMILSPVS